jgi:2-methylcitrate dehydratase PrpD
MSLEDATLINGTSLHSTELEAVPMKGEQQPAFTVFSALAMAEKLGLSGRDVLEGFILGFEVHGRLSANAPGIPGRGGWGCVTGTLGAAATAGKLLKFNTEQMRMALGFASSQASGLIEHVGTTAHFVELGMAIAHGIRSALWVNEGLTAMLDVIENHKGFLMFYAGKGGYDLEEVTRGLGSGSFYITDPGVSIKKYPCCFRAHRALDTTLELMDENHITYKDIDLIQVDENLYDRSLLKYSEPKIGREGRFSMEHCIAAALVDRKVDEETFSETKIQALREARQKVKVIVHEEWPPERGAARTPVLIRLKNGKEFQRELKKPKDPTREQILERYKANARMVLSDDAVKASTDQLMSLERVDKVDKLMELLRGKAPAK